VPLRIGFDMLAVQSPHHGHRGIGRYGHHLVSALLDRDDRHEYFLYAHASLPLDRIPTGPRAQLRHLGPDRLTVSQRVDRLARVNPDALDTLVVLSPFERWENYQPPGRPVNGPRLAAVVHDMIPFLFAAEDGYDPVLMRHYRVLEDLKRYDALLANSDASRNDCQRLLGLPVGQVSTIGAGSDERFFMPDPSGTSEERARSILEGLGITRPFVLNVGGLDARKNVWRLIDAFARLPQPLPRQYQLVLTFDVQPADRQRLLRHARAAGLQGALVVTGEVSDAALRVLYQRCTAFVFPSLYEGFGLPILEAMHCGAAVVAGNNSSQIEVVGDAGLLANASDPGDIAAKLAQVLQDRALAQRLRARAVVQARRFRWSETAARAAAVLGELPARRPAPIATRPCSQTPPRPRIALFSPFPPRRSGVSDYAVALVEALKSTYTIDLYHESGYVPEPALTRGENHVDCYDARLFPRLAAVRGYHAIVYQMGNSHYHRFLYKTMLRYPGIVTLHDFCLVEFHLDYGYRLGRDCDYLRQELLRWYPDQAHAIDHVVGRLSWRWQALSQECAERGWYLNRAVLATAEHVVVHSPWCAERVRATTPGEAAKVDAIPHGIWTRETSAAERAAIRARFGLPRDALLVGSFGFVNPQKMSREALDAFRSVARCNPSALFVFAGEEADGGAVRRHAESLGLSDRVRFLGRRAMSDFTDLIATCDLGVNLRRPPTNGETSGALLHLLAAGVATIVTDVGTFSDYPDSTVRKVRWETEGFSGLERALTALAADAPARAALGRAAQAYTRAHHEWPRVAARYASAIERCHARRCAGLRGRSVTVA
jgi:glycosyltransferase involved in cell wall biosynthesis